MLFKYSSWICLWKQSVPWFLPFPSLLSFPILQFWLRCQFYNSSCWLLKGMTTPYLAYFIKRTERDCLRKHRVCTQKIAVSSETFWLKLFHCNPTFLDIWADLSEAWRWDLFNCFIRVGVLLFKEQERERRRLFVHYEFIVMLIPLPCCYFVGFFFSIWADDWWIHDGYSLLKQCGH